ncbi:MAG: putative DNA-binding domain-containing protein [Candidatus Thiothrix sulfatifontis]|nr:MAG: putative DNA-binding domain-containing protein [Candidatus Thiothrix sulfatifontis]
MNATEQYQRTFAAHLRNPQANPAPAGVNPQRMDVYVELLFNNVEDFLSSCFPVMRSILDDGQWNGLVRQFYADHACQTPYFREIPAEFVQWLTSTALSDRPPFLLELAHYEWVEIPLMLDEADVDWRPLETDSAELARKIWNVNPVMLLQSYQYPVHRISPDFQPDEPESTHLVLLRNTQGKVDFVEVNAVTARLLQLLQEGLDTHAAVAQLAQEMQHPEPTQLLAFAVQIVQQLHSQQVLLGAA